MLKYIGKRLLMLIPVLLGVTFGIYLLLDVTLGDPAQIMLGSGATREEIASLRTSMGLDDPVMIRYMRFLGDAVRGNFGRSWYWRYDVMEMFLLRVPYTIYIGIMANILAIFIGIPFGIIGAVKHNRPTDYIITFLALVCLAAPTFWFGMMLQLLFSIRLRWLPVAGVGSFAALLLPSITNGSNIIAGNARITRTWLLDVIRSDYIRTARAKGAKEFRVITVHALRNALLPVITVLGANFAVVIGGLVVTESVFAVPGIGSWLTASILGKDTPVVMCIILLIALFVGIINLLVDLIYALIDPRVNLHS